MAKKKAVQMPQHDDRAMILDPDRWPCWPWLPLKRRDNSLENGNLGCMFADGKGMIVYHVYMFAPPRSREELDAAPSTKYATVDELLADGWTVD